MKKKSKDRLTVREVRLSIRISTLDARRLEKLRGLVLPAEGRVSQGRVISHALYLAERVLMNKEQS